MNTWSGPSEGRLSPLTQEARPGMKCQGYKAAPGEPRLSPIHRALFCSPATSSPGKRRRKAG